MGDMAYACTLFAEKVLRIKEVIQANLFWMKRQLYIVALIYDDILEFYINCISEYRPFSCGGLYIFNRPDVEDQTQEV